MSSWREQKQRIADVLEPISVAIADGHGCWRDKTARLMRSGFIPFPSEWDTIARMVKCVSPDLDVHASLKSATRTQ